MVIMRGRKNWIIVVAVSLVSILAVYSALAIYARQRTFDEAIRAEAEHYELYLVAVKERHEKLRNGMTRGEVEKLMAMPPDYFFFDDQRGTVTWHWNAVRHVGILHRSSGLAGAKGHFNLSVTFDSDGSVKQIGSGVD